MLSKLKHRHELQVRASKGNLGLTKKNLPISNTLAEI